MNKKKKEIKCVIWDLDNTIWDGVLLESVTIKIKSGIKEVIKKLDSRGILNSIASRNNYDHAMDKLKEFNIGHYFLYPEINWGSKSKSISKIQKNLNIGFDSLLFIDDEPFERDEVQHIYPDVMCLDAKEYSDILNYPELNPRFITEDSKKRRIMYLEDIKRKKEEETYEGPDTKFLESLNMKFTISEAKEDDLKRAEELTVRTNQLNATGKTYGYNKLDEYRKSAYHKLIICELEDKYGSYGKIGLALIENKKHYDHIRLMLMSCRVMSRGAGTIFMSHIMNMAKKNGKKLRADFKKTKRNRMMYVTYKFANFNEISSNDDGNILFENDLSVIQKIPPYIKICI